MAPKMADRPLLNTRNVQVGPAYIDPEFGPVCRADTTYDWLFKTFGISFVMLLGLAVVGLPALILGKRLLRRRKLGEPSPQESVLKLWWKKLRVRKGASAEREGRTIRMEAMNTSGEC